MVGLQHMRNRQILELYGRSLVFHHVHVWADALRRERISTMTTQKVGVLWVLGDLHRSGPYFRHAIVTGRDCATHKAGRYLTIVHRRYRLLGLRSIRREREFPQARLEALRLSRTSLALDYPAADSPRTLTATKHLEPYEHANDVALCQASLFDELGGRHHSAFMPCVGTHGVPTRCSNAHSNIC